MQFGSFAFVDTGVNLNHQYLVGQGPRLALDFAYVRRPLALLRGLIWFSTFELIPAACFSASPSPTFFNLRALFVKGQRFRHPLREN